MDESDGVKQEQAQIVAVDDDESALMVLERLIKRMGHQVICCQGGKEALGAVTQNTDLVLLDLMMPGMSGLELLAHLKGNPDTLEVPVLMVTALTERDVRLEALNKGAADFLTKPVDLVELQARIKSHVQARKAHKEVKRYRDELEQLVDARTRKLANSNQKLHNEMADRIKMEMDLRRSQEQLRELTTQLAMVEERERRNIVADLHDRVCQSLAIAQIRMEQLNLQLGDRHKEAMGQAISLVEEAISDVRTLMYEISPQSLYELGLATALEELAEQFDADYDITVRYESAIPSPEMDQDARGLVYRAVRELMINAVKHSQGTNLDIMMDEMKGKVRIQVEDDGQGFSKQDLDKEDGPRRSFGLMSLKERLRGVGGRVSIESEPGRGARVSILLDMPQQ